MLEGGSRILRQWWTDSGRWEGRGRQAVGGWRLTQEEAGLGRYRFQRSGGTGDGPPNGKRESERWVAQQ